MLVCPFTGVRVFADETLHYALPFPTGGNPILHRPATVEKCTFCAHRVVEGLQPVCVEACSLKARTFGDLNDPNSDVSQLLRNHPHFQLLVEKGTDPSTFYLT
jgi:molybdopterin-containing oxidoreductase family iron-sulfur binding subunit